MPAKDESDAPDPEQLSTIEALQQWRSAERLVAVARRGRVAAEAAAQAAQDAADAAIATSDAAKAALEAMGLAEQSAAKTAAASKIVVMSTRADLADAETDVAMSEVGEADAHAGYRAAEDRARRTPKA